MILKINKPQLTLLSVHTNSKYLISGNEDFTSKEIAFNRFMVEKFTQSIPSDKHYMYLPTAILTNLLIHPFDGIVFPSVATNLQGENFALKTELIDNHLQVIAARVQETYNHSSTFMFKTKCLYQANHIDDSGIINWQKVNCKGHKIDTNICPEK